MPSTEKLPMRSIPLKRPRISIVDDNDVLHVPADVCLIRHMTLCSVLARGILRVEFARLSRNWRPSDSSDAPWHLTSRHYVPRSCG